MVNWLNRTVSSVKSVWLRLRLMMGAHMDAQFLHFAYGSNMLARRLTAADRAPSAKVVSIGYVPGYRFTFDKRGEGESGKGNMNKTGVATDRVYGVVFTISRKDEASLDKKEGYAPNGKKGYDKLTVTVRTPDGPKDAIAYIARIAEPGALPFHWYKAFVVAGAVENNLPAPYIEWLRTFASKDDTDDIPRRTANEALLFANELTTPQHNQ